MNKIDVHLFLDQRRLVFEQRDQDRGNADDQELRFHTESPLEHVAEKGDEAERFVCRGGSKIVNRFAGRVHN